MNYKYELLVLIELNMQIWNINIQWAYDLTWQPMT